MTTNQKPRVGLFLLLLSPFILVFLFFQLSSYLLDDNRMERCDVESDTVVVEDMTRDRRRRAMDRYYIYIDEDERFRVSSVSYDSINAGDSLIRNQYFYEEKLMATALTSLDGEQLSFRPEIAWYFWFPIS